MQHSPLQLRQKLIDTVNDRYHYEQVKETEEEEEEEERGGLQDNGELDPEVVQQADGTANLLQVSDLVQNRILVQDPVELAPYSMEFQEEENDDVDQPARQIIDVDTLHTQQVPNINGNLDAAGQFHEWHETYTVQSTSEDLLHILPYTLIDF